MCRRGAQLHILAPGMAKRVHNSTRYDSRQKLLRWHVEWSFLGAGCKVVDQRCASGAGVTIFSFASSYLLLYPLGMDVNTWPEP